MENNKAILDKGTYTFRQEGAFLSVKQYMLIEKEGKRCLLLRFFNASDIVVNAMEFLLIQLDADGKVISKDKIAYDDLNIRANKEYALKTGIVIKKGCVNFRVYVLYAVSGEYKYVFRNGQAVRLYDPRGYDPKPKKVLRKSVVEVKRRYAKSGRIHVLISLLGVLLITASCVLAALGAQSNFGKIRDPEPSYEVPLPDAFENQAPQGQPDVYY